MYGQIIALCQRIAQVAGQVGVFKIGLVVGAGRQYDNAWIVGVVRGQIGQSILQRAEKIREPGDFVLFDHAAHHTRQHCPVLQRVACTGWGLCTVAQHPHPPAGAACKIGRIDRQLALARQTHADTLAQKSTVPVDQFRRQQTIADQRARTVDVIQDQVEQFGALLQTRLDHLPIRLADDVWNDVQRPGPVQVVRVAVDVVGDAVLAKLAAHLLLDSVHLIRAEIGDGLHKWTPMRLNFVLVQPHFVIRARLGLVCM